MPGEFDVVLAMYHDQGLIPVKYLGVDKGVNVTLGLPLVRTSPTTAPHLTLPARAWPMPPAWSRPCAWRARWLSKNALCSRGRGRWCW
jgi:hypothetical protein